MNFIKKIKKFQRNPKQFLLDSRLFTALNKKEVILKEVIQKEVIQKDLINKREPSELGDFYFKNNQLEISTWNKKIINEDLGFSTLVIIPNQDGYLINKRFSRNILLNRNFIAFKEKSVYFLKEKDSNQLILSQEDIYINFSVNKTLRGNPFQGFRNLVYKNPITPIFVFARQSTPALKTIIIVDNFKSLGYIKNYTKYIDILIIRSDIATHSLEIPRIIKYQSIFNSFTFATVNNQNKLDSHIFKQNNEILFKEDTIVIDSLKTVLVDTSYKKDCNLIFPIISNTYNLKNIDYFNENNTIEGLIKFDMKTHKILNSFDDFLTNIEIKELYLRENLYCIYKDMILNAINKKDYLSLLKKTLKDGVNYERI